MTWIKICGTTNLRDARLAVEAGADAIGFVFHPKSPRHIDVKAARRIVKKLPDKVEKVGVFVQGDKIDPLEVLFRVGLTGTQTYVSAKRNAARNSIKAIGITCLPPRARFMMALPMKLVGANEQQVQHLAGNFAHLMKDAPGGVLIPEGLLDTFVLDSGDLRRPGGTGRTFDWQKAVPIAEGMREGNVKLVVAGGLTPENVGEAIKILRPWGVDVASGVEAKPGKKDPKKVRAFVKAVRAADKLA